MKPFGLFALILCFAFVSSAPVKTNRTVSNEEANAVYGDKFEGDIVLTVDQSNVLIGGSRNGQSNIYWRWENRIVPYQLGAHSAAENNLIVDSLRKIESLTCIKFVPRTNQNDYVRITNENSGCWSYVGRIRGAQPLNLGPGCLWSGVIIHEFLHALGFFHMQSTHDRDNFVIINYDNIAEGAEGNFDKYSSQYVNNFNVEYDYKSIMHYESYAFSKNGRPTIVKRNGGIIDYNGELSSRDILRIKRMYGC